MLDWHRTGKITMRADDYLIIRFQTGYTALHGPQCDREILGTADAAKAVCEAHKEMVNNDTPA